MAKVPSIALELNHLFPSSWLWTQARAHGAVQRVGKVNFVVFFWALVLAPVGGHFCSLANLQRLYEVMADHRIATSAYLRRFSAGAARFFAACALRALEVQLRLVAPPELFARFTDVLAIDSTLVALIDSLAANFPGARTNTAPATVKINAIYSVLSAGVKQITVAAGKTAETKVLKLSSDIRGSLLLMDLGYFAWGLFATVMRRKAFFISRLKANANPIIVADLSRGAGRRRPLVGQKLRAVLPGLHRETLDVLVRVPYYRSGRTRGERRRREHCELRVVGVRHPVSGELHLYVTNVLGDVMTPEQIRLAYSARWFVELLFDELKHDCGMAAFPSAQPEAVRVLLYVAVIRLAVSRVALSALIERTLAEAEAAGGEPMRKAVQLALRDRISPRRFTKAFNAYGLLVLQRVLHQAGIRWRPQHLDMLLAGAAIDPNNGKDKLMARCRGLK
jgi:putative transposase